MENFIFGLRPIYEALKANKNIDKVLVKSNLTGEFASEIFKEIKKKGIQIQHVPVEKLNKLCKSNHQGAIAYLSPINYFLLAEIIEEIVQNKEKPLFVILDGITDVRNFGAIARTAECAGVDAIIIPKENSVRISEDAIKTSAGALFNIKVCRESNLVDAIIILQQFGVNVFAVTEKANFDIYSFDFNKPAAFVLGSEENGISNSVLKRCDDKIKIPMFGKTESLNVSVSTSIVLYETIRQRL